MSGKKKLQHAYSMITSMISRGEYEDSKYFPSIASLANRADVSVATIWRVIDLLRKEGRLVGAPRRRISLPARREDGFVASSEGPESLPPRRTKCLALQQRIQRDILNGRFRHDSPLPTEKELTVVYGVSWMTLRKALLALVEQSILVQRGTRFSPMPIRAPAKLPRSRIVLLGQGELMEANILWGYWHKEYFKLMELECAKSGYNLDIVCFSRSETGLRLIDGRTWQPYSLDDKSGVEGYIYEVPGTASMDDELLLSVSIGGRPVAVLDEVGAWPPPAFLKRHSNVRVFRNTLSALPARQVARFVMESGHRTAVFVSPFHHLAYSRLRYNGLAQEFSTIDGARIIPITLQDGPNERPLPSEVNECLAHIGKCSSDCLESLPAGYRHALGNHLAGLNLIADEGKTLEDLYRLCDQALKVKGATVWIFVNDFCAHWANTYLNSMGIGVPEDLSIMSFDDDPIGLGKSIASYSFNIPSMVIAMFRFITGSRLFPVSRPVIEIEGNIVPRRTMGWVRKA